MTEPEPDAQPEAQPDARTDSPEVAALLRERVGYERAGRTDRVEQVDAALKHLGYTDRSAPPRGRRSKAQETT